MVKHEVNILSNEATEFKLGQEITNTNSDATNSRSFNTFGNYCGLEQSNETNNPLGGLFSPAYYQENVGNWINDGTVHGNANADFRHNGHNGSTIDGITNSGLGFTGVNSIEASFSTLGVLNADKVLLPIWCNGIIGVLNGAGGYGGTATNDGDDRNSGGAGGGGGAVLFKTISFENDGNYYYSIRTGGVAKTSNRSNITETRTNYRLSGDGREHYHGPAGGDSVFMLWYKDTYSVFHLMYMAAAQGGRGVAFRPSDGSNPSYGGNGGGIVIYAKKKDTNDGTSINLHKVFNDAAGTAVGGRDGTHNAGNPATTIHTDTFHRCSAHISGEEGENGNHKDLDNGHTGAIAGAASGLYFFIKKAEIKLTELANAFCKLIISPSKLLSEFFGHQSG